MLSSAPTVAPVPARVLVVDDSAVIRQAIEKMLKKDFELVLAEDGEVGWGKLAQDTGIKALITDIEMPRLDGYAFICRIRAADDPRIRDLPIITITGAEDEETRMRAYACGATDFITKPLNAGQLQARVHAYMDIAQPISTEKVVDEQGADPLTGLHGRRYFLQRGEQEIKAASANGKDLSLIRLDIDQFKKIYQKYGDEVVDQLLTWLAKVLTSTVGREQVLARIGGAEFAILAPAVSRPEALALCDRLRAAIFAEPFKADRSTIAVNVSMGVASLGADRRDGVDALMMLADQRLAHAKSEGGNRVGTTALTEGLPEPEELVLSGIVEASPAPAEDIGLPEVEELSISELEELVKRETFKTQPAGGGGNELLDLVSVDKALQLLTTRGHGSLSPYLGVLVAQVLPLFEAYNEKERLGLESSLQVLKERLAGTLR